MTTLPVAPVGEEVRAAVRRVLARWDAGMRGDGLLDLLAPMHGEDAHGRALAPRGVMNAQLSMDTRHPDQLRLTLDPFAGQTFWEVRRERLLDVLRVVECRPLLERALRLHTLGYALPQSFWLGLAPTAGRCVVKAYVASPDPVVREWLPQLARDAGWLPPTVGPAFVALYDRLVPSLAVAEGIGISFAGETWLGTTFYLRATMPWAACTSAALAEHLGLAPAESFERLPEIVPGASATFGWSLECDPRGALVDAKLEIAIDGRWSRAALAAYARDVGVASRPLEVLADALAEAGLSGGADATPAVMSLRFVQGSLRSMVAYFPVIAPGGA